MDKFIYIFIFLLLFPNPSLSKELNAIASILEQEIHAGDSIENVSTLLKKHKIKFEVMDDSASFDEFDFHKQLPKVKDDLLKIVVYEIDLRQKHGIILQFNFQKNLCGYLVDLKFGEGDKGLSIADIRTLRPSQIPGKIGQKADGKEDHRTFPGK